MRRSCRSHREFLLTAEFLTLLLSVSACTVGPAESTVQRIGQRTDAIQGGQVDNANRGVVGIISSHGRAFGICSGTLIAPNLVLTAQHCVASVPGDYVVCGQSGFGDAYPAANFGVTLETEMGGNPRGYYDVRQVIVAPSGDDICGSDIALLVLSRSVGAADGQVIEPRLERAVRRGERFTAAGYGEVGDGSGSGVRRKVDNREVICTDGECSRMARGISRNEWIGSDGVCQGDSGGPAIDADGYVLGALSRGGEGCTFPIYSSVHAWGDWLRDMGEMAAEIGGYPAATWVTEGRNGPPPPDTDGDGYNDRIDNCVDIPNPDQADLDGDRIGDPCDDHDDRDRGGNCAICNACVDDSDCGAGDVCAPTQAGLGLCTRMCNAATDCPDTTTCFQIERGTNLCLNSDADTLGPCHDDFVCGGRRIPEIVDDELCHVCEPCESDDDCNTGVCADLGAGPVCTRPCDPGDCRGDAICADVSGHSLCVNPHASESGICPEAYVCGEGGDEPPEPEPETEPDAGVEAPFDGGIEPGSGSGEGSGAGEPSDSPEVKRSSGGGCSTADGGGADAWPALLLLALWFRRSELWGRSHGRTARQSPCTTPLLSDR